MASAKVQSATLRLSPEHLGPVEVHIDMQASQINVNFVAAHPDTRSALEQSVPTLRAMLAHGGLTLGQTQVQGEARSGSQSGGRARDNALPASGEEPITVAAVRSAGLIDEYA
jgi:flagellar hook-length control protein FliK